MRPAQTAIGTGTLLALLLAAPSDAEAMRCGNRLVSRDDSRARVVAVCGQPEDVSSHVVYLTSGHFQRDIFGRYSRRYVVRQGFAGPRVQVPVQIEHWVYNFGSSRLMRRVIFTNGRVERIETLGYGYDARRLPPRDEVRGTDTDWRHDDSQRHPDASYAPDRGRTTPAPAQHRAEQRQPADEPRWRNVRIEAAPEYAR